MRLLVLLTVFVFSGLFAQAQHHHYIYIQSEPQQAFYIKIDNVPLSSNTNGFLIIPKLTDTTYTLVAGFPQNLYPEYKFVLTGIRSDKGYTFKNFAGKGWGMIDNQTRQVLMGEKIIKDNQQKETIPSPITNDQFTVILASVINDPTLPGTELVSGSLAVNTISLPPVETKTTTKSESPPVTDKTKNTNTAVTKKQSGAGVTMLPSTQENKKTIKDTVTVAKTENTEVKTTPPTEKKKFVTGSVKKLSEKEDGGTVTIAFLDTDEKGKKDTVLITISNEKTVVADTRPPVITEKKPDSAELKKAIAVTNDTKPEIKSDTKSDTKPEIKSDTKSDTKPENKQLKAADTAVTVSDNRSATRSDCRRMATDKDVQAVRRKIIAIREVDDMVATALKDFKTRCFTAEQVKSVSIVFVGDEGKYKLLDAAYPYVYDPANYSSLVSLLNEDYYINRFRSLLK